MSCHVDENGWVREIDRVPTVREAAAVSWNLDLAEVAMRFSPFGHQPAHDPAYGSDPCHVVEPRDPAAPIAEMPDVPTAPLKLDAPDGEGIDVDTSDFDEVA